MKHMESLGIRALKINASAIVRRVAAGESFTVTDRGRPVARLVPWAADSVVERLIADGHAVAPVADGDLLDLATIPPAPGVPLPSRLLAELRRDER
jgi:prevent-host-death family protein